ncbi:hypothetical protein E4S40_12420 [Algoriphagus kandeliae]|uniref:Uncharacterized protein n=1 Tax=Algoriphagus kandeliae TaxID=2562278 RepID=A0A4Y9QPZ5_9BACT|nr:hypothetical protein [Algoriphagus kandeliae]TFV93066.1 hypothetical protein E4S40_12420 [Algoriphagus kandeliae]
MIYIGKESLTQPGLERFEGKYEEIGFYRNENNTGPVKRIYAIHILDEDPNWMKEFGEALPHTKYGTTSVYFFSEKLQDEIALSPSEPHFPQEWQPYLKATFEKTPMGEVRFTFQDHD